jgi:hypothetical protein
MTTTINASPTNGLVQTADGSGVLKVQSNGVTTNALAWVNFNGTGTVAIRSSYNVSSITDNGTGDYTINFTTALADANYCGVQMGVTASGVAADARENQINSTKTTTAYRIAVVNVVTSNYADVSSVNVAIFGN